MNCRRLFQIFYLLSVMNIIWVSTVVDRILSAVLTTGARKGPGEIFLWIGAYIAVAVLYLMMEILPCYERGLNIRLQVLSGGYEIICTSIYALLTQLLFLSVCLAAGEKTGLWNGRLIDLLGEAETPLFWGNLVFAYIVLLLHYLNGFWRTAFCSSQLGIGRRLLMLFFWWVFPVNLILFYQWCKVVRRELMTERSRYLLDTARVENAVCHTRYPVVMVHGIFFRDWQYMNYWGRIPQALKRNGAQVYYGRQQSSLSVADSAAELKAELERVLQKTGAEKLNIVAHSKGGLDARYAISKMGMAEYVASLTTINTPHRGCRFVDALLGGVPQWLLHVAEKRYNSLFHVLGDEKPDFLAGIRDLTAASCKRFNEEVPDAPGVYYQSVMSKMYNHRSSFFPLNISYLLAKHYEGENDGLVSVSSAVWGNFLGILSAGRKGISHGDMIDLTHKDILGFDVKEFYVGLLEGLKKRGL